MHAGVAVDARPVQAILTARPLDRRENPLDGGAICLPTRAAQGLGNPVLLGPRHN